MTSRLAGFDEGSGYDDATVTVLHRTTVDVGAATMKVDGDDDFLSGFYPAIMAATISMSTRRCEPGTPGEYDGD